MQYCIYVWSTINIGAGMNCGVVKHGLIKGYVGNFNILVW